MEIVKILAIAILVCIVASVIKQVKPELAISVVVLGGAILLIYILNYFTSIFNLFNEIISKTGINKDLFSIIIKIIGVGYLVEFSADLCSDSGNNAIADKVILGGKIIIFIMAIPIIENLFNIVLELIN